MNGLALKQVEIMGFCQGHSWVWGNFLRYFSIASYWSLLTNSLPQNRYPREHKNPVGLGIGKQQTVVEPGAKVTQKQQYTNKRELSKPLQKKKINSLKVEYRTKEEKETMSTQRKMQSFILTAQNWECKHSLFKR